MFDYFRKRKERKLQLEAIMGKYSFGMENPYAAIILSAYKKSSFLLKQKGLIRDRSETLRQFMIRCRSLPTVDEDALFGLMKNLETVLYTDKKVGEKEKNHGISCSRVIEKTISIGSGPHPHDLERIEPPLVVAPPLKSDKFPRDMYPETPRIRYGRDEKALSILNELKEPQTFVSPLIAQYILEILYRAQEVLGFLSSRDDEAAVILIRSGKLQALTENRPYLVPDDIKLGAMKVFPDHLGLIADDTKGILGSVQTPVPVFDHEIIV